MLLLPARPAQATAVGNPAKIFLVTTSYGVMAGSLIGLASLAFFEDPGNHMKNVAMGSSLGLYAGILLGAYMVYVVPEQNKPHPRKELDSLELDSKIEKTPLRPILPYIGPGDHGGLLAGLAMQF